MEIIEKRVVELIPYEKNPRKNDGAVEYVKNSIKEFGFKVPIVIDKDNVVIAGHTRLKAAKKLGLKSVPCIVADDLTEEQVKAFRLADNKVGEFAEWDIDLLDIELNDISINMEDFGFDFLDKEDEEESKELIEDEVPEVPEEPKSNYGDIYILGEHRLMCGDSTNEEDIKKLTDGKKVDLVFTDPPYGMKKENDGVLNDNLNYDDLLDFNKKWIPLTFKYMKNNGSWYCWGTDEPLMDIYSNILKPMKKEVGEYKLTFRNLITWDKGVGQGQLSDGYRMYPIADEKCLFVMRGRQSYGLNKDDYWDGFEPIRQKLIAIKDSIGITVDKVCELAGASTCTHWFSISQWEFPNEQRYIQFCDNALATNLITREEYDKIREEYDKIREEYDKIREEYDKIREEWYKTRAYFDNTHDNMNDVWHFQTTSQSERKEAGGHATPKPIALCSRAIKTSSRENEIVLDVFGGSGSTLITCEQLNRKCYVMELEPKWVDVIIKRWENFTGKKAELVGGSNV